MMAHAPSCWLHSSTMEHSSWCCASVVLIFSRLFVKTLRSSSILLLVWRSCCSKSIPVRLFSSASASSICILRNGAMILSNVSKRSISVASSEREANSLLSMKSSLEFISSSEFSCWWRYSLSCNERRRFRFSSRFCCLLCARRRVSLRRWCCTLVMSVLLDVISRLYFSQRYIIIRTT